MRVDRRAGRRCVSSALGARSTGEPGPREQGCASRAKRLGVHPTGKKRRLGVRSTGEQGPCVRALYVQSA